MFKSFFQQIWPTLMMLFCFTFLLGFVYPGILTFTLQTCFPKQANGSLIKINNQIIGSELIGQPFSDPKYFWSRPSATTPAYNAANSCGSNLGSGNPVLIQSIKRRIEMLQEYDKGNVKPIPVDLVTFSASGLDPHISVASALYQLPRIAKIRNMDENKLHELLKSVVEHRKWGILGEARINVVALNLKLDEEAQQYAHGT